MPSILCARTRMGRSVIEAVLADFDRNGPDAVRTASRAGHPAGYAKTLCDLIAVAICCGPRRGPHDGQGPQSPRPAHADGAHAPGSPGAGLRAHGQDAIATLRTEKPQAWARLLSEVCQFRLLPKTPKPAPRREPRPVRMKSLIQALAEQPVDPTSALLPMTQAQALPDALAAVPRGTWPQPVEVWRQAFGQAWDDALAHWLAIHLPGPSSCPRATIRAGGAGLSRRPGQEHRQATGSMPSEPPVGPTRFTAMGSSCGGADPSRLRAWPGTATVWQVATRFAAEVRVSHPLLREWQCFVLRRAAGPKTARAMESRNTTVHP